ncbi:hypothetical protein Tco_0224589, partial [Tanacetum coccineum]
IVNREHEEYISLMERLLYDNSSPRSLEDFHANPNMIIESLPTFPILVEDSDSLREEINIFLLVKISDPILMFLLLSEKETRFTIRGYALKSNL